MARYQELPDVLEILVRQSELAAPTGISIFLQAGSAAWLDKKNTEWRFKELLLDELFNGQLIATGYRQFPTTSPGPIMIDAEAFDDAKINWNDDIVQVHGRAYGRVRITDAKASHIVKIPDAQRGRQGSAVAIRSAINRIAIRDAELCNLDRKTACKIIRDELNVTSQKGNGLSDQNLSKYIIEKCGPRRIKG